MSYGIAVYKCNKCNHTFAKDPGPVTGGCPKCKGEYLIWINYDQWKESYDNQGNQAGD